MPSFPGGSSPEEMYQAGFLDGIGELYEFFKTTNRKNWTVEDIVEMIGEDYLK